MRSRFALVLLAFVAACAALDAPCPCGGHWQDSRGVSMMGPQANVPHARGDHCVCRCDDEGDDLYMPPFQKECAVFEVACTTPAGTSARFVCR